MNTWCRELHLNQIGDVFSIRNNVTEPSDYEPPKKRVKQGNIAHVTKNCFIGYKTIDGVRTSKAFETKEGASDWVSKINRNLLEQRQHLKICLEQQPINRDVEGCAILETTRGEKVKVDDEVYRQFLHHAVFLSQGGYPSVNDDGSMKLLHRIVMDAKEGEIVDHINCDKLNCCKSNLRITTPALNAYNRTNRTGRYRNVVYRKNGSFSVVLSKDGIAHSGGTYRFEKIAAWAADSLAQEVYGKNAKLNGVILNGYIWKNRKAVCVSDYEQSDGTVRFKNVRYCKKGIFEVVVSEGSYRHFGGTYHSDIVAGWAADCLSQEIHASRN